MNETPLRLSELPPGQEIFVVCAHGNRSAGVSGYLLQQGFRAVNLRGGMAAWQAQGGPVESDYRHP
jgi:rhodanese-related sulfurtransferase